MPYTLKIPSAEVTTDPQGKQYTAYHVTLQTPLRTQVLRKRYSEFTALDAALKSTAGQAPPASLPPKAWPWQRTVNNPELTEQRRKGLEAYLLAIENDANSVWRNSAPYRTFLGFSSTTNESRKRSVIEEEALGAKTNPGMTSSQWLDLHTELKGHIQSARLALAKRDQAQSVTLQHESSAQAKKWLVKAQTLIARLDQGLKGLAEGKNGQERLGDGEIRRRKDMLSGARKERLALEGVLNSPFATRSQAARSPSPEAASLKSAPGAFPTSGRRVLGGPAKETERTRELDNAGVLQLQQQIMQEQDLDVSDLSAVVRRMKEMGVAINEELVDQGQLLDVLDQDVDRVDGKISIAKKKIRKIK